MTVEQLEQLFQPELEREFVRICEVRVSGNFGQPLIQLFVDYEDRNITINDCIGLNRIIKELLDTVYPLMDYRLEISSPGIESPLKQLWQFKKNIGKYVRVQKGLVTIEGTIREASDDGTITLEQSGGLHQYSLEEIAGVKVVLLTFAQPNNKQKRKRNEKRGR